MKLVLQDRIRRKVVGQLGMVSQRGSASAPDDLSGKQQGSPGQCNRHEPKRGTLFADDRNADKQDKKK